MKPSDLAYAGGEPLFHGLLESIPDAVIIVNTTGTIVLVNSKAEKLFGYPRAEMLGKPFEMLLPPRFRSGNPGYRNLSFAEPRMQEAADALDLYGLRQNGEEVPIEISLQPLRTEDEMLVSSTLRDVTARKREDKALHEKTIELEAGQPSIAS